MPACPNCDGPLPCDCWKGRLTPKQREALQDLAMARRLAVITAAQERRAFDVRQATQPPRDVRGRFGNRNAATKEQTV